ncbi:Cytochrome p450 protein [Lasiodiplodia theobromae]|uniref:Cytochrome p450 protein n=1 Tax=Lasiodiplodia theobromae TaxID=45133 RepID=UPI0015C3F928|nr:Cytochrome p450 protein [Lasiodiplodia theobromae]KAF4539242.1 Cytochrome p450 protein [Lasiodiplodia theobromae]
MALSPVLTAVIVAFLSWGVYKLLQIGKRDPRLPPGPPTLPVLGNIHQIPLTGLYKKLKEWGDQYGDVYSIKIANDTMIVLYDRKAIHDLLDKKSAIYSDRPPNYVADLVTNGDSIAFMNYDNPAWRAQRKISSHNLSPRALDEKVAPIQEAETAIFMNDLLRDPSGFYNHVKRTTASTANIVVWGHRGPTYDDFWGSCVYKALEKYSEALEPGANPPCDQIPFLKYIPDRFAPWKRRAKLSYTAMDNVWREARRRAEERRAKGVKRPSIFDRMEDEDIKSDVPLTQHQVNHFLGVLVEGAADTTAGSMLTSIMLLTLHPEVQKKAQAQLDEVCGVDRVPSWADFDKLQYINGIVKEGTRWKSVLPLGVPHSVTQDDYYEGMLIPKGATIVMPVWGVHHNEKQGFSNPETYDPGRWAEHTRPASELAGLADFTRRDHYSYGSGRRICPGMHLAERTMFRMTAKMLWAFDIVPATDPATGEPIALDTEDYEDGIITYPKPYKVEFRPRSEAHMETIKREAKTAQEFLSQYA